MRRHAHIQMETYRCKPSGFERAAMYLLVAIGVCGATAAVALAWGLVEHIGAWPL